MDDNKKQNQTNQAASDYQKILDEYAASVKPETNQIPENSPTEAIPIESLKETISLPEEPKKIPENTEKSLVDDLEEVILQKNQPQPPVHPSLTTNLETEEEKKIPSPTIEITPEPVNFPKLENSQPEKTPEEIKAEINRLLTEDDNKANNSVPNHHKSNLNIGRIFFVFALILFLLVAAGLAYFLFITPSNLGNKNTTGSVSTNSVTPTTTDTNPGESCELNEKTYQVGESFLSADGCNTCSCQSAGFIACTEKACADTSTITPATKSATVTSTTKTAFQKMIANFTLYKDVTSNERLAFTTGSPGDFGIGPYWTGSVKSGDKIYSFTQKIIKGSIKILTVDHRNLNTILAGGSFKNGYDYTFYLTPNYENWTTSEFKVLNGEYDVNKISDLTPVYAYSDKLIWTTRIYCGGARSMNTDDQKIQDQCELLIKEIPTAFP
ncbi:MAG: hypothetical protein KIH89_004545 [Candidatus Shapirobacteria bacterium]|nr:hypothetical protein [Candidatus Shapirobacteria bacterium]